MLGAIVKMKSASRAARNRSKMQESEHSDRPCSVVSQASALKWVHAAATATVLGQAEQFTPSGNFEVDFKEICSRAGLPSIGVVQRKERPTTVTAVTSPETTTAAAHNSKPDKGAKQSIVEQQQNAKLTSTHKVTPDDRPTTYTTADKCEYFKPRVEVKGEQDGCALLTEFYIRGWQLEPKLLDILKAVLPLQEKLHTIDLWNVGLDDTTLDSLTGLVQRIPNVNTLRLDGNTGIALHRYEQLIDDTSTIQHLSLRHCYVNDAGASLIGHALVSNKALLTLNLSFNKITCDGAKAIARGLRRNRTLLTLNLSNNRIADEGAEQIAKALGKFSLTHDEVVLHRKLLSKRNGNESVSPTRSIGQSSSKESTRPQSVRSGSHLSKDEKKGRDKAAAKKKDGAGGGKQKEEKGKKGGSSSDSPSKSKQTKKTNVPRQDKGKQQNAENEVEEPEAVDPLLDTVDAGEHRGEIWVRGNRSIINLNLARNSIGERGLAAFAAAVQSQTDSNDVTNDSTRSKPPGLLKISLQNNAFPRDHSVFADLLEVMKTRDPIHKQTVDSSTMAANEEPS